MSMTDAASAFAGATNDRAPSAKFDQIGRKYAGTITRVGEYAGINDLNGNHETSVTIDLETDEGTFTLWCRTHIDGQVKPNGLTRAIADAVRAAGGTGLPEVGGKLAVLWESEGQSSKPGMSPPKIYRAQYAKPAAGVSGTQAGGPFDAPAQAAPVAQAAPAPAATPPGDDLF